MHDKYLPICEISEPSINCSVLFHGFGDELCYSCWNACEQTIDTGDELSDIKQAGTDLWNIKLLHDCQRAADIHSRCLGSLLLSTGTR